MFGIGSFLSNSDFYTHATQSKKILRRLISDMNPKPCADSWRYMHQHIQYSEKYWSVHFQISCTNKEPQQLWFGCVDLFRVMIRICPSIMSSFLHSASLVVSCLWRGNPELILNNKHQTFYKRVLPN
jgi:hypothetical protein